MARRIDLTPMPLFDAHGSPSSLGQHWKQWLTRSQTYVTASGITDDTQKRTMITATSGKHSITRNVSFFKHFNAKEHKNTTDLSDDEDDYKIKQNCDQVIINRRYPLRNRELPQRYVDLSSCIITHG